jgi:hypothetical protein
MDLILYFLKQKDQLIISLKMQGSNKQYTLYII